MQYVASNIANNIANNIAKRQKFNHDNVKKTFYKFINTSPYKKTIENVVRRTDIRLLYDMEKRQKLAKKLHSVNFRVLDNQVAPPEEHVEVAAAKEQ